MFWKKKKLAYEILIPPLANSYNELTKEEAEKYFTWFCEQIPNRINYVSSVCSKQANVDLDAFDLSPQSLIPLWKWFLSVAVTEKTSKKHLAEIRKNFSYLPNSLAEHMINDSKLQFSLQTEYILRDIGMYLGEVFVRNNPSISWGLCTDKKNNTSNRPILQGFKDGSFEPVIDPISLIRKPALEIMSKNQDEEDLYRLYAHWLSMVPNKKPLNKQPAPKNDKNFSHTNKPDLKNIKSFLGKIVKIKERKKDVAITFQSKDEMISVTMPKENASTLKVGMCFNLKICNGKIIYMKPSKRNIL